jgi:hypothetical protein
VFIWLGGNNVTSPWLTWQLGVLNSTPRAEVRIRQEGVAHAHGVVPGIPRVRLHNTLPALGGTLCKLGGCCARYN